MVTIRPGSHTAKLLTILSFTGEFPVRSLRLLGSETFLRRLVTKLSELQDFRLEDSSDTFRCRLLIVSGKSKLKTIRLSKAALPILERFDPDGYRYYTEIFKEGNRSGSDAHVERKHRLAEALAICQSANIQVCPYALPKLQNTDFQNIATDKAFYYEARILKALGEDEANRVRFSRITGAIFYPDGIYAVYNSRDALMKWNGKGEAKARLGLEEIGSLNLDVCNIPAAIMLGSNYELALRTIQQLSGKNQKEYQYGGIYNSMHFIPMNSFGIKILTMLTLPDWKERLLTALFPASIRAHSETNIEHDAFTEGTYLYSFLDSDILRLNRFREGLMGCSEPAKVFCFPEQADFLRAFLGSRALLLQVKMSAIEARLSQHTEDYK